MNRPTGRPLLPGAGRVPFLPVALVGAGSMAEALVRGILRAALAQPSDIRVTNRSDRRRLTAMADRYGVRIFNSKEDLLREARCVVLAVKPVDASEALEQCRQALVRLRPAPPPLLISVAAGLDTCFIEERLPPGTPVVRAMPNTSCTVGESATALTPGRWATRDHLDAAASLFGAVGYVVTVTEDLMDVVTGLSGSGPAYLYLFLEAMTEAGIELGLDPELSYRLALQTVKGAAATAQATGEAPAELRRKVSSPGGTTVAGLAALEQARFREGVIEAVRRAAGRAAELAAGTPAAAKTVQPATATTTKRRAR